MTKLHRGQDRDIIFPSSRRGINNKLFVSRYMAVLPSIKQQESFKKKA